jgi:hypothetical protein
MRSGEIRPTLSPGSLMISRFSITISFLTKLIASVVALFAFSPAISSYPLFASCSAQSERSEREFSDPKE